MPFTPTTAFAGSRASRLLVRGLELEVLESGGTNTPIFVFHGNSSSASAFLSLLGSEVGRHHRIIAVSWPGHGASAWSSTPLSTYRLDVLGQIAAAAVSSLAGGDYYLVGNSLGGHVLLESLPRLPRARGLLLVAAPPITTNHLTAAFQPDPSGLLFKGDLDEDEISTFAGRFVQQALPSVLADLRTDIARTDPQFRPALGASIGRGDLADERATLAATGVPTALLCGEADRFLNTDYIRQLPSSWFVPDGVTIAKGVGHAVHLDAPDLLERTLSNLLQRTGGRYFSE
jgi:pimeloyl-ACP methyl ester carboxylesterase